MSNLACYTSNGRIRELIIFDKESYSIEEGMLPGEKMDAVARYYQPLVEVLNRDNDVPVNVYVLFDVMEPDYWAETKYVDGLLTLLPVNTIVQGANIPTQWTQDVLHVQKDKTGTTKIRVDIDRVSPELFAVLERKIPGNWELDDCSRIPAGGNCVRIKDAGKEICFVSKDPNECPEMFKAEDCFSLLQVEPDNYHLIDWKDIHRNSCYSILERVVFHADQYITPAGRLKDDTYLFFVPDVRPARFGIEKDMQDLSCLEVFDRKFKALERTFERVVGPVTCLTLPLFVLDFDNNPFGLCYNNCLVEHYIQDGDRRRRILFPDFTSPVRQQLAGTLLNNKVMKGIRAIIDYASITENTSGLSSKAIKGLKTINEYFAWQDGRSVQRSISGTQGLSVHSGKIKRIDSEFSLKGKRQRSLPEYFADQALDATHLLLDVIELTDEAIRKVQEDIRTKLKKVGIQSDFINLSFRDDAQRLGGLHCRVKVIGRDGNP